MGVLKTQNSDNILTRNGFTYTSSNVTGELKHCYERGIRVSDTYFAWVAVNPDTGEVVIYIEYDCGGQVAKTQFRLTSSYLYDSYDFFNELDTEVTDYISSYR